MVPTFTSDEEVGNKCFQGRALRQTGERMMRSALLSFCAKRCCNNSRHVWGEKTETKMKVERGARVSSDARVASRNSGKAALPQSAQGVLYKRRGRTRTGRIALLVASHRMSPLAALLAMARTIAGDVFTRL